MEFGGSLSKQVNKEIIKGNPWYVGEQFQWAANPYVVNIYNGRFKFISAAIKNYCEAKHYTVRLIDLGCGDGVWLKRISELKINNLKLTGIDYNELRIKRAREILNDDIDLFVKDIQDIEAQKYDIILLNHVIEHVREDELLLKKIKTILSETGIVILGTPNEGNYLMQRRNRIFGYNLTTDHVHFYTISQLRDKFDNCGYSIFKMHRDPLYTGNDKIFYKILTYKIGYIILSTLGNVFPYLCSGFLFVLVQKGKQENNLNTVNNFF